MIDRLCERYCDNDLILATSIWCWELVFCRANVWGSCIFKDMMKCYEEASHYFC